MNFEEFKLRAGAFDVFEKTILKSKNIFIVSQIFEPKSGKISFECCIIQPNDEYRLRISEDRIIRLHNSGKLYNLIQRFDKIITKRMVFLEQLVGIFRKSIKKN